LALTSRIRLAVYRRDRWACRHCHNRNGLHPHHIIFKSHRGKDALDNLVTVCHVCHRAIHDGRLAVDTNMIFTERRNHELRTNSEAGPVSRRR
jgi:5-methylcytosine-specific restriction endonuclease McrA